MKRLKQWLKIFQKENTRAWWISRGILPNIQRRNNTCSPEAVSKNRNRRKTSKFILWNQHYPANQNQTKALQNRKSEQVHNQQGNWSSNQKLLKKQKSRARWLPRGIPPNIQRGTNTTYSPEAGSKNRNRRKTSKLVLWVQHYLDPQTRQRPHQKGELQTNIPDEYGYQKSQQDPS